MFNSDVILKSIKVDHKLGESSKTYPNTIKQKLTITNNRLRAIAPKK
ncbi:hypothetical protein [Okeania sp. KiyG1]|nr:hypothetical protein [Okeania sp. KiyG1]